MSRSAFALDLCRDLAYLLTAIFFLCGAAAAQKNPSNSYSGPLYVACAVAFFLGAVIGVLATLLAAQRKRQDSEAASRI